ncbi:MAG TPA: hypothetical protein DEA08_13615 [Planctomycetes bacterium]|nr:hypothetical protein [Planctomycetota bacterium]
MLRVADAELADLGAALTKLQARTAGTGLELSPEVDAALACAGRLARALAQALDAEDLRGEHHDLGGSG